MSTPFHWYLFRSIVDELVQSEIACDVILNDLSRGSLHTAPMYDALESFIRGIQRDDIQAVPVSLLLDNELRYACVVSPYMSGILPRISHYNVRVMYGLAKENWNFAWWNVFYDKICCFGPYDYDRLTIAENCTVVGNPRFDPWFGQNLPATDAIAQNLAIDLSRPTVLYAPTYGELSSIDRWLPELVTLQDEYNVIVKLHHGTAHLRSEERRRRAVHDAFSCVVDDTFDLLNALKVADFLITDNSGVLFDGLLADKNIVLLETELDSPLTNEQSAEQVVRRQLLSITPNQSVKSALRNMDNFARQQEVRPNLVQSFFGYTDNFAGQRAAQVIRDLLAYGPQKNIFLADLRQKCFDSLWAV